MQLGMVGLGRMGAIAHYRDGIVQVAAALDGALSKSAAAARDARLAELTRAGVPEALARRLANLPLLKAAPDIVLVADRAKKPVAEVTATYFAAEAFFQLDRVAGGVLSSTAPLHLDNRLQLIGERRHQLQTQRVCCANVIVFRQPDTVIADDKRQ